MSETKTDPSRYRWQRRGNRILCFDDQDILVMNVDVPKTLREALLSGFFTGVDHG